jgi:hypothetical protein
MWKTGIWLFACVTFAAVPFEDVSAQKKKENQGAGPKVIVAMPMAVEPGKTTRIVVRGLGLDSATGVQMHEPKSTARLIGKGKKVPVPANAAANQVGDSEIEIEVTPSKEIAGGVVPFSIVSPGGESKPHPLIVKDDTPIVVEKEPNDGFKQAQPITVPCIVEGGVRQAQDVDVFRFEGKKGEQLVFEVQANRFGSPLDGILTLYDDAGRVLAGADDSAGSLDPILRVSLPHSGGYFLSLIDAHDQGGEFFVYRLIARSAK